MTLRLAAVCLLTVPAVASDLGEGGDYGMVIDVASRSRVPYAGTTDVVTRSLVHVRLSADDSGGWSAVQRVCDVKLLSDSRAKTVLPDSFVRSLPVQSYAVNISEAGGWVRYQADPGATFVGFDPAVTGGVVPRKAGDPGVVDTDGDGKPGVTVRLVIPVFGAVKIYVAQKGHSRYVGAVTPDGVDGRVDVVSLDQRTLGASFAPFAANPEITAVPESSRFTMRRIERGLTCDGLRSGWGGDYRVP